MPGISGVEATRQISMIAPLTRVLVLTISDQDSDVMDAILAGACGYLLKDSSITELISGIQAAAVGESLVSPAIASKVLQRVRATSASPREAELIQSELSDREIQVLKLIANGKDNAMIAAELHISPKTVKNHISNILMKLQIENRIQAAVYAVRSGSSSSSEADAGVVRAAAQLGEQAAQLRQVARRSVRAVSRRLRARARSSRMSPCSISWLSTAHPPLEPPAALPRATAPARSRP